MKIEIWSDVACPWCYIGKRRFETALAAFPHRDSAEVQWRSYQLDPTLPEHYDGTELDYLSTRKGMAPAQVSQMFEHVAAQAGRRSRPHGATGRSITKSCSTVLPSRKDLVPTLRKPDFS